MRIHTSSQKSLRPFHPIKDFLTINEKGHLEIDKFDTIELARKYDTPLYVISERRIRANYQKYLKAFRSRYANTEILYAVKASPLLSVCRVLQLEGAGFEVGGPGELHMIKCLGVASNKVHFNGNNKSRQELRLALEMGITINIDSLHEIDVLEEEARKCRKKAKVSIRVNPDVPPSALGVHSELWTGVRESKFGLDIKSGLAQQAFDKAHGMANLHVAGIHTHIGSPVEETTAYKIATERIVDFVIRLKNTLDIDLEFINMGGGFAIPFKHKDKLPTADDYAESITKILKENSERLNLKKLKLLIEPGGAIVGDTTILLLSVGMIKELSSSRKWLFVDGGANIILRASQGWYVYQFVAASKMQQESIERVNIAGPLCYSGDVIAFDRSMPHLQEGDIIAALDAGAYTFAYEFHGAGSHPFPAIVLIRDSGDELIRRSETLSEIVSTQSLPHLGKSSQSTRTHF